MEIADFRNVQPVRGTSPSLVSLARHVPAIQYLASGNEAREEVMA